MQSATAPGRMDRSLVAVMAVATGLAVANNYYAQPLLPAIGRTLHVGPGVTGLIVTVAQIGYAVGLVLLLPLGDLAERRGLVSVLSLATGAALVWLGASPSMASLLPAALVVGAVSVMAQVLVPFAASLAAPGERGRVVGMVMSGLLVGVLLARTVAGYLAETGTWRVVYFVAAGAMVVQAGVLRARLPRWKEAPQLDYPRLVGSVLTLLREEPVLRLRSLFGLLSFGTFSVLWTSLAFLLAHHYRYPSGLIGLFGLAGAAGAVAATAAGRFSDRGWAPYTTGVSTVLLATSWAALWAGGSSVVLLVVGIVVLDVGAQGIHITNQGEIYRLRPEARSRLTAAYMVIYFAGGAAGSVTSATVYDAMGWNGVCLVGAAFAVASVVVFAITRGAAARGSRGDGGNGGNGMAAEQSAVVDRPDQQRFVLEKEGAEAELVYRTPPGRLVVVHTGVPRHLEGQGLAGRLVRAATERAARERLTLVPQCWYAARWLHRNPDAAATVAIDWDGAGA